MAPSSVTSLYVAPSASLSASRANRPSSSPGSSGRRNARVASCDRCVSASASGSSETGSCSGFAHSFRFTCSALTTTGGASPNSARYPAGGHCSTSGPVISTRRTARARSVLFAACSPQMRWPTSYGMNLNVSPAASVTVAANGSGSPRPPSPDSGSGRATAKSTSSHWPPPLKFGRPLETR